VWEGKSHTVQRGSPQYPALKRAVLEEDWDSIPANLTVQKSLHEWAEGRFSVAGTQFFFEKTPLPGSFNQRIVEMASGGEDPGPLLRFWERLQKNPSKRSVDQLWEFLKHEGIPLTPTGTFLAYKSVQHDYKDWHSGKHDNSPGTVNEMPRNQISDDPNQPCHDGFHVGALAYVQDFHKGEGRIVVCEVDPADVVCVPYDSSQHKMRVSRYKVTGNHGGGQLPSTTVNEEDVDTDSGETPAVRRSSLSRFRKLDDLDVTGLMKLDLVTLRQYAAKGLQIAGASKVLGGKTALVLKIVGSRPSGEESAS